MAKLMAAMMTMVALSGCTDEDGSRKALEAYGFTGIRFGGHAWIGCSDSDEFKTKFTATNPAGRHVEGVVCCGWLKSCTVRF